MSILSVRNISKSFDGNTVLDDVSFDVIPSKINLLIGANGSGKTTLLNIISGIIKSDSGFVYFLDNDITKKQPHQISQKKLIRTFQTPKLFPSLSVFENLLLAGHSKGESFRYAMFYKKFELSEEKIEKKALVILDSLNLSHLRNNLAYDLSGGQIKLLEIGKALMSDSVLVLLDEPIAGINPVLAHSIFSKISHLCEKYNMTFLIIEHRLDIALKYADYVFVLHDGKIIASDKPENILNYDKVIKSYLG